MHIWNSRKKAYSLHRIEDLALVVEVEDVFGFAERTPSDAAIRQRRVPFCTLAYLYKLPIS